jgi:hypothetical protein
MPPLPGNSREAKVASSLSSFASYGSDTKEGFKMLAELELLEI